MGPARTENHFHLFIQGKAYTFGILRSLLCKMEEIIGSSKVHHLTVSSPPWWSRIKIKTQLFTYPSHVSSREMNKHLIGRIQRHTGVQVTSEECTKCQVRDLNFYAEFDVYPNVNISAWFCWIFKVKRRWQIHKYPNNLYMSVLKYSNKAFMFVLEWILTTQENGTQSFFDHYTQQKLHFPWQSVHTHSQRQNFQRQLLPYIYR